MATNRPTYAPDRRPGDPTGIVESARELVILTMSLDDSQVIGALIESGAAALELAPTPGGIVSLNSRRRDVILGRAAARALFDEALRVARRDAARHTANAKRCHHVDPDGAHRCTLRDNHKGDHTP